MLTLTASSWAAVRARKEGKDDFVEGGPTKAKSEKTGFWTLLGGDPARVMLDHAGYPTVVKVAKFGLMIHYNIVSGTRRPNEPEPASKTVSSEAALLRLGLHPGAVPSL